MLSESGAIDAFDNITCPKGQAFSRMLENYLGEKEFRAGIRSSMAQHAYGGTTTADLWAALEKASGKQSVILSAAKNPLGSGRRFQRWECPLDSSLRSG